MIPRPFRAALPSALLLALSPAPARAEEGACPATAGAPAVLAHLSGFSNGLGIVRVQAYGPDPATFLQKHQWARRVELRLAGRRSVDVCLPLPGPGRYAIAVRHDANVNGKSDWNDGGGFSRNPHLSLFHLRPDFDDVAVPVRAGVTRLGIVMNYRHGLSIGPAGG